MTVKFLTATMKAWKAENKLIYKELRQKLLNHQNLLWGIWKAIKTLPEKPTEFINSRPLRKSEECVS